MSTIRVHAPEDGLHGIITVNGRTYTAVLGTPIDVPDFDGAVLIANGWTCIDKAAGVGATAARPASPTKGMTFLDTTLGYHIQFDGRVWRNPVTGASI